MRYYREIQRLGFDGEAVRSNGSTTKIYIINKDGDRIRTYYENTKAGKPTYYHVDVKSREGALLNFKYCRDSSAAHQKMKELLLGIPEMIRKNNEWIDNEIEQEKVRSAKRIEELEALKTEYQAGEDLARVS